MNKIFTVILGILLFIFGIGIIMNPKFYDSRHGYYYDFTEINIPFGSFLILMGISFIYLVRRKKARDYDEKVLICPKCKQPFVKKEVPNQHCPMCNEALEELEGFYERYSAKIDENGHEGGL